MEGWLFDLYPAPEGGMIIWLVPRQGKAVRIHDPWRPRLYVKTEDSALLGKITQGIDAEHRVEHMYVNPGDFERSQVSCLAFRRAHSMRDFVRNLSPTDLTKIRLFNADIPSAQLYLYEKDLFPLAFLDAHVSNQGISWELRDDAETCEYDVPPLKGARLKIVTSVAGKIPSFKDPLESITVEASGKAFTIEEGNETSKLLELAKLVQDIDPDIILTENGDAFIFPYLIHRALHNDLSSQLILDREGRYLHAPSKDGKTYFSYGRIYYKPTPSHLLGRLHLDVRNDFIFEDCGLHGLIETARTCRTPLHRASRETIGTNMTSLQMYQAFRRDILIPWKKNDPENFKSAWTLLKADRGGFILEPKFGLFDAVGEIDFASLYPTLMMKHNLTPECISCPCCGDDAETVPDVANNLCAKKVGIVPHTLRTLLQKRAKYKALMNHATDKKLRSIYDQRQAALKWALVCSFGYLGYRNARFGKIDAHIAVCAFARKVLRHTVRIAQQHGFTVVHGIVDSVWLKKAGAHEDDYVELCRSLGERLGLPVSFEGIYRWIMFLPSKVHTSLPVLNRYYGVFQNGKVKVRGIEYRRRDTPEVVRKSQRDFITYLAPARDSTEFRQRLPEALRIVRGYVRRLRDGQVDIEDLLITKQLSKELRDYTHNVTQVVAARQLAKAGAKTFAGQTVSYVLQSERGASDSIVLPAELFDGPVKYDVNRYVQLLLDSITGLLGPLTQDTHTALSETIN